MKGIPPAATTIPIRFHVYWAGGDQDGAVAGYYWAVVETLVVAPEGGTPPLPGPHPADYHYTTRSDSIFVFNVSEDFPDRQHAFFVYAVDDKGKPDPTPARFIFNALDRFPPVPVFDEAVGIGTVYFFDDAGVLQKTVRTYQITDTTKTGGPPKDTVPSGSRLRFRFHGQILAAGTIVKGFRYKLDEAQLQPIDPDSLYHGNEILYHVPAAEADPSRGGLDTLPIATGTKLFTLRAVDQANGSTDRYHRFQMNFSPDTWFSGPDPDATGGPWQVLPSTGEKYAILINGLLPPEGLPGSLMTHDSVEIMPVNRPHHKTFLEVYKDSVFLRKEGDTVHLGCWVIVHNGGFDKDSPYLVNVAEDIRILVPPCPQPPGIHCFPDGPVLRPDTTNGSPVGFRSLITNYLTPNGPLSVTQQSRLYPFFDPNNVLNFERIAAYHPMTQSGKAYSLQRAEDGDGARDNRVDDARRVVELPIPEQLPLVMTFNVNFPPVLETDSAGFIPSPSQVTTFTTTDWLLEIIGNDRDPFAQGSTPGGPTEGATTLRLRFTLTGKDTDGNPLVFLDPPKDGVQQKYIFGGGHQPVLLKIPTNLAAGPAKLTIELCDCSFCELNPGEGRCIKRDFDVYYQPTATRSRPGLR